MTLRKGFGAELALPHGNDLRYDLAGTVVRDSTGAVRAGIFAPISTILLSGHSIMAVAVAPFSGVAVRDGGPVFLANDGSTDVVIDAAPSSNSRLDVVYAKQNDASSYVTTPDADNNAVFGVLKGIAAASPVRNPAGLPAGALEIGTVLIPSTATATTSAGVVISQTALYTAMAGGTVPVRNSTELSAWAPANGGLSQRLDTGILYQRVGGVWLAVAPEVSAASGKTSAMPATAVPIIQTGRYATTTNGAGTLPIFTFPTAFPNGISSLQLTVGSGTSASAVLNGDNLTITGFTAIIASAPSTGVVVYWTAIGW